MRRAAAASRSTSSSCRASRRAAARLPRGSGLHARCSTKLGDAAADAGDRRAPPETAAEEEPPFDHDDYETVVDEDALDRWIAEATRAGLGRDRHRDRPSSTRCAPTLVGISLALAAGPGLLHPARPSAATDCSPKTPMQLPRDLALAKLKPLLDDPAVLKIGHNIKYDMIVLGRGGLDVAPYDDTMLMSFDLDAGMHGHGMDELATTHLSHSCISFKDVCGTGKKQLHLRRGRPRSRDALRRRGCRRDAAAVDALQAAPVARGCDARLRNGRSPARTGGREHGARTGSRSTGPKLARLSADFAHRDRARSKARSTRPRVAPSRSAAPSSWARCCSSGWASRAGARARPASIRPTSPSSNGSPPTGRRGGDAWCSTGASCRSSSRPTPTRCRQQINPETGRVHTSYQPGRRADRAALLDRPQPAEHPDPHRDRPPASATRSWPSRAMSCSRPTIRRSSCASPRTWPTCPHCARPSRQGDDIHNLTAQELFGEVNRDTRGRAKTINFAILYGISALGTGRAARRRPRTRRRR